MKKSPLFVSVPLVAVPLFALTGCGAGTTVAAQPDVVVYETTIVQHHVTAEHAAEPAAPAAQRVLLRCDGKDVEAEVHGDTIEATIAGEHVTLHSAVAASGAKYTGSGFGLWSHHDEWLLLTHEGTADEAQHECTVR